MAEGHLQLNLKLNDLFRINSGLNNVWLYCKVLETKGDDIIYKIYGINWIGMSLLNLNDNYILEKLDIDEVQLVLSLDG